MGRKRKGKDREKGDGERYCLFFFFKQKTAYEMCGRDWSSDVCSSNLPLQYISAIATPCARLQAILPTIDALSAT